MDKMKQTVALAVLGALVLAAGGWFLLVSPKRSEAAELRAQADERVRGNQVLVTKLTQLKAQAKELPAQQAKLAAVAAKIPANSALPNLVRALNDAAEDLGVELVSIAPGSPAPLAGVAAAATTTAAGSTPSAAGAAGAAPSTGVLSVPVSLNVVGSYFQVSEYLDRLETLKRAFRVTGFTLTPGLNPTKSDASQPEVDTGKVLTAAITGLVFQTQAAAPAAVTAATQK